MRACKSCVTKPCEAERWAVELQPACCSHVIHTQPKGQFILRWTILYNYALFGTNVPWSSCCNWRTPQPASLLLPLPPPAHVRGKRPVNPYIGVLAQKDACMTTKISILKRRSGGSVAYVVTFGWPMATGRRRPEKRWREGNECSYCFGSRSGLNKCAPSRVHTGAKNVIDCSA